MHIHKHSPFEDSIFKCRIPTDIAVGHGQFDDFGGSCAAYEGINEDGSVIARLDACRLGWIERGTVDDGPI